VAQTDGPGGVKDIEHRTLNIQRPTSKEENEMKRVAIAISCLLVWFAGRSFADEITVESVPPVVVKSVPQAGASDVDPATKEIKVTFSKTMTDGTWTWGAISKECFPELAGKPKYLDDKKTCVLPVKLKPGKTYAMWINAAKLGNFKDADGRPALPYLLVFKTKE
jgi:hypothetical protein